MFKEHLLREILRYVEQKRKLYFTYEEFLVYLYYRYRGNGISFGSIMRKLRTLAKQGYLYRKYITDKEWGFTRKVVFYANLPAIRATLRGARLQKIDSFARGGR